MIINVKKEQAALERLGVTELRAKYAELFGEATRTGNKTWLIKRIVWRLQSQAEGDLSERARRRAAELANDADLRLTPPKAPVGAPAKVHVLPFKTDDRLPPPGSVLTRKYKGRDVQVHVLSDGFEYAGDVYTSLSAVAKAIIGSHCNGFLFFGLTQNGGG